MELAGTRWCKEQQKGMFEQFVQLQQPTRTVSLSGNYSVNQI